ncbi:MAG: phage antirepressor KilAC domain-containing protein [Dyadobacter sp.]|uniref:phage antirepressor KilAC domain-containing protein n=1 Tax=Dyadobacter sp. TaxID=1914288 RepID=UPI001B2D8A9A|nr:phage antirepressor KilAC domain-containing protein [Dyadobacter sp.]MBO9615586.1 phage antirepressor KilAC domain-containing protein [Dyadobacter sp.]
MQELIQIQTSKGGKKIVSAKELYDFLDLKSRFNDWIRNRIKKYGFIENQDFVCLTKNLVTQTKGGRAGAAIEIDYALTLNMAKELAMVEGNERGKQARQYFIACETMLKTMATPPAFQLPTTYADALRKLAEEVESKERLLQENAELKPKAAYTDIVLNSVSDMTTTIVAKSLGMSAVALNGLLSAERIIYKKDGCYVLYQKYADKGYATYRTRAYRDPQTGETKTVRYLVWTEAGKEFIHRMFNYQYQQYQLGQRAHA